MRTILFFRVILMVAGFLLFGNYLSAQPSDRLRPMVTFLASDSLEGRSAGTRGGKLAAEYIGRAFQEIGLEPMSGNNYFEEFQSSGLNYRGTFTNVVGYLPAETGSVVDEVIIVGAHFDHLGIKVDEKGISSLYPGADDNASGIALLIETARRLSSQRDGLRRSIFFVAFDAEEIGLLGSTEFVRRHPELIGKVKVMINFDMIGSLATAGGLEVIGTGTLRNDGAAMDHAADRSGIQLVKKRFEQSIFTATDTQPFAEKGIPTLFLTTGTKGVPYHKPEDTSDRIDYNGLERIAQFSHRLIGDLASQSTLNSSGKIARKHRKPPFSFHFGIAGTLGANRIDYANLPVRGKSGFTSNIGLYGQFNMNRFALRTEVLYQCVKPLYYEPIELSAIVVPLDLLFMVMPHYEMFNAYALVGGYYRHFFNDRQGHTDFAHFRYPNDGGVSVGCGVKLSHFTIEYKAMWGLSNLTSVKLYDSSLNLFESWCTFRYHF